MTLRDELGYDDDNRRSTLIDILGIGIPEVDWSDYRKRGLIDMLINWNRSNQTCNQHGFNKIIKKYADELMAHVYSQKCKQCGQKV